MFPGCDAPVDWSDAHHIDHWHLYERTELARCVLLCRFHHHCVHEGGYTLERSPTGTITVTRPDGTTLPQASPGQLIIEPDEPDGPPGTGPPDRGPTIPAQPGSRFRSLTMRRDAEQRELGEYRRLTRARLDALIDEGKNRWPDNPAA